MSAPDEDDVSEQKVEEAENASRSDSMSASDHEEEDPFSIAAAAQSKLNQEFLEAEAVTLGNVELVQQLLAARADGNATTRCNQQRAALHNAAEAKQNSAQMIKLLAVELKTGGDVNVLDRYQTTPLHVGKCPRVNCVCVSERTTGSFPSNSFCVFRSSFLPYSLLCFLVLIAFRVPASLLVRFRVSRGVVCHDFLVSP